MTNMAEEYERIKKELRVQTFALHAPLPWAASSRVWYFHLSHQPSRVRDKRALTLRVATETSHSACMRASRLKG
ncbi:hypothetical protein N7535_003974 [Penicillium sp. DV-2018c]|nr:hypothetical protein N7535_003974 [Penicillium sp. DV-2018c]